VDLFDRQLRISSRRPQWPRARRRSRLHLQGAAKQCRSLHGSEKRGLSPHPLHRRPKKIEGLADYSIRVDVPLVEVAVMVTTKDGQFISTLRSENFCVYEDGVPQAISNSTVSQAPITAVLLVEFASTNYAFVRDALRASYSFANTLKKDDWATVVSSDIKPQTIVDFTQDKGAVYGALNQLRIPGFAETNLFRRSV
jgi:hypothetical protein